MPTNAQCSLEGLICHPNKEPLAGSWGSGGMPVNTVVCAIFGMHAGVASPCLRVILSLQSSQLQKLGVLL